jgi:hypothetical protein
VFVAIKGGFVAPNWCFGRIDIVRRSRARNKFLRAAPWRRTYDLSYFV